MSLSMDCSGIDLSTLNPTQFKLVFNKIPNTEFFCQSINIPGLSLNPVIQNTPMLDLKWQGEKFNDEPIVAEIILDKGMKSYAEIYKWIKGMSVLKQAQEGFSDCALIVGDTSFQFYDVWPTSLSPMNLSIATPVIQTPTFSVVFEYDYFEINQ